MVWPFSRSGTPRPVAVDQEWGREPLIPGRSAEERRAGLTQKRVGVPADQSQVAVGQVVEALRHRGSRRHRTHGPVRVEVSWSGLTSEPKCAGTRQKVGAGIKDDRLQQHRAVLEAIEAAAPEAARERMATLLQDSIDDVRRALIKKRTAPASRRARELA